MPGAAFGFDTVAQMASALADEPFKPTAKRLPEKLAQLSPEQYHAIRFHPEASLWRKEASPFQVQFFPRGSYFRQEIAVNEID